MRNKKTMALMLVIVLLTNLFNMPKIYAIENISITKSLPKGAPVRATQRISIPRAEEDINNMLGIVRRYTQLPENLINFETYTEEIPATWSGLSFNYEYGVEYKLEYYVIMGGKPVKIAHKFTPKPQGENEIVTQVFDDEFTSSNREYRIFNPGANNGAGAYEVGTMNENNELITNINIDTTTQTPFYADRGNVVQFDDGLDFRYIFEPRPADAPGNDGKVGKFTLTTSGVKAGTVTEFTITENDDAKSTLMVLEQIANFGGNPSHYMIDEYGDKINAYNIYYPEIAGEKPGFDITLEQPQLIVPQEDGKYQLEYVVNNVLAGAVVDVMTIDDDALQLNIEDDGEVLLLGKDDIITDRGRSTYDEASHMYTIPVVKDHILYDINGVPETEYMDELIQWTVLKPSQLMDDVNIKLGEDITVTKDGKNYILDTDVSSVVEPVYTYMEFKVNRITETTANIKYEQYVGVGSSIVRAFTPGPSSDEGYTDEDDANKEIIGTAPAGTNSNTVPIPLSGRENSFYLTIDINEGSSLRSQRLWHNFANDDNINPPFPRIEQITNVYAVPPEKETDQPKAVGMDIMWSAPMNSETNPQLNNLLENGKLFYELLMYNDAETVVEDRVFSKVFVVELVDVKGTPANKDDDVIEISSYAGAANEEGIYNDSDNFFIMKDIELKSFGKYSWNQLDKDNLTWNALELPFDYPNSDKIDETPNLKSSVPETYYFTIRAIYDSEEIDETIRYSNESNPVPVTFNITNEIIPVVTTIDDTSTRENGKTQTTLNFSPVDIQRYIELMLDPTGWDYINDDNGVDNKNHRTYEIFLYQHQTKPNYNPDVNTKNEAKIATSSVGDKSSDLTNWKEKLRNGETIKLSYDDDENDDDNKNQWPKITLTGLDDNQTYYVKIRVAIESEDPDVDTHYSQLSKEHTFTTYTTPLPPDPSEQRPTAPIDIWIEEQQNNVSVDLAWEGPEYQLSPGQVLYYELIRVEDNEANEEILDPDLYIEEILTKNPDIKGFSTEDEYIKSLIYDGKEIIQTQLNPKQYSITPKLYDSTLTPNNIYYYYIRTVVTVGVEVDNAGNIIEAGDPVASEWIYVPVTTEPIERPINLKIEKVNDYKYIPTEEVVISFMAALPEGVTVPDDYDFELAIKGENDGEFLIANSSTIVPYEATRITEGITTPNNIPNGYRYFVYKITGLESSTRYDIKVRIVDFLTEVASDEDEPRSLYSDKVVYNTEVKDGDTEDDDRLKEFLEKYDSLVLELKNKAYWVLNETENTGIYKYKEGYLKNDLRLRDVYDLVQNDGQRYVEYYFPMSTLMIANDHEVILRTGIDTLSIDIRPNAINTTLDAIKEARKDIDSNKIQDYYIKLSLGSYNLDEVNFEEALTPEFNMEFEVVTLSGEDWLMEESILDSVTTLIDEVRVKVEDELIERLEKNVTKDSELQAIVDDNLQYIKYRHQKESLDKLEDLIEDTEPIETVDSKIMLQIDVDSEYADAYFYSDDRDMLGWEKVNSFRLPQGYGLEVVNSGSYALAGTENVLDEVPTLVGEAEIIEKYNLDEVFNLPANLNNNATRGQVYTAIAKILNVPDNTDPIRFLQSKGLKGITPAGKTTNIRQDDAIYALMQLYEQIYFKDISNVLITNRQSITNIGAFNPSYREYIYAAEQLNFIETTNNQVYPSKPLKVKEILDIITDIMID